MFAGKRFAIRFSNDFAGRTGKQTSLYSVGLQFEQKENYEFVLSQEDFLDDVADMMSLTVQLLSRRKTTNEEVY